MKTFFSRIFFWKSAPNFYLNRLLADKKDAQKISKKNLIDPSFSCLIYYSKPIIHVGFSIPIISSNWNSYFYNTLNLRNLQLKKYSDKLIWPFNVQINCSCHLKYFSNSRLSALSIQKYFRSLEYFLLTVGNNNFQNKIPILFVWVFCSIHIQIHSVLIANAPLFWQPTAMH